VQVPVAERLDSLVGLYAAKLEQLSICFAAVVCLVQVSVAERLDSLVGLYAAKLVQNN